MNLIFSETNNISFDYSTIKNANALVLGGSGSGKTFHYTKLNIEQISKDASFVVVDPMQGELLSDTKKSLLQKGYTIKILDLRKMPSESEDTYNPLSYLHGDADVFYLASCLVSTGECYKDECFIAAKTALLSALIGFIWKYGREFGYSINFNGMMELLRNYELNQLFAKVEKDHEKSFAVNQYKKFSKFSKETQEAVKTSMIEQFPDEILECTKTDKLGLEFLRERKTAIFVIIPMEHDKFNFLGQTLCAQTLYLSTNSGYPSNKDFWVNVFLEEFPNMGLIPEFVNILAVAKKYKVSISCYLQSIHQLGAMYGSLSAAICENFDNILYMGGACTQTMRFISEKGRIPLTKVQDLPAEECILITPNRVFISPKAN